MLHVSMTTTFLTSDELILCVSYQPIDDTDESLSEDILNESSKDPFSKKIIA